MLKEEVSVSQYVLLLGFAEPESQECSWELCTIPRSSVRRESENTAAEKLMRSCTPFPISQIEFYFYIIHSFYKIFGPASLSLQGLCSIPLGF